MAGHSKWANIKFRKERQDAKKGKVFTKIIKEVTVAARIGGGDIDANPRLRKAVLQAKQNNMPMANIENAIKKGTGELPGVVYEEVTYEGYGPAGVAIYILTQTDNRNRTVGEIRHILSKNGGNLGENGSVAWIFDRKGLILIPAEGLDEDELMLMAIDAGAEDLKTEGDFYEVYTPYDELDSVKTALEENDIPVEKAELTFIPQNTISLEGKQAEQMLRLMDSLEDNDDVQDVFANFDIDETVMEQLGA
ncbi:MAG TPA: YebC/PmpR family DNA-binding transcriptional regulator [Calditrichia bacterium]|nr:YebC/PmpR family DNA-binding transcriptional regulator [Calditrichota bacterium]HQU72941.1 YebC/PmpR family DNA-binding transcriptional regulator [Calditrichia bacterium]HQV32390.1 YebC/PmpR family DNA-binding transcriptional regulator [Calditrichia bacterium]